MWLFLWCIQSRSFNGPIWHNTSITFEDCPTQWPYTLAFVGNIFPMNMDPYKGCYQTAFPI